MRTALIPALLVAAALLVACGTSDDDQDGYENVAAAPERPAPEPGEDWLADDAGVLPERWLVTQLTGEPVAADDDRVRRIGQRFDALDPVFVENRRMLANRSLQLHRMLAEAGIDEPMARSLEVFEPTQAGAAVDNFSQYIGYYATLRRQGFAHDKARELLWHETPPPQ